MGWGWGWRRRRYVPAAAKRAKARKQMDALKKGGKEVSPVRIEGRAIAKSFWGKGWCDHMESFHDYENRLPRGRTYVRNGSVVHLEIAAGTIKAFVAGSDTYTVTIGVAPLPGERWAEIKKNCAGQIASLVDLLQGRLSDGVMRQVASRDNGLFPHPKELTMACSCPDWAEMCKHVAAVCYGVGARLDEQPELLFRLRGVDHGELATSAEVASVLGKGAEAAGRKRVSGDLSEVFGIDMADDGDALATAAVRAPAAPAEKKPRLAKPAKGKPAAAAVARPRGRPRKAKTDAPASKKDAVKTLRPPGGPRKAKTGAPASKKDAIKTLRPPGGPRKTKTGAPSHGKGAAKTSRPPGKPH